MAIVVHVVERGVPNPIPWLKMGWANMIVITVLDIFGFVPAFGVVCLRVFVGALLSGTLFGPSFLLSCTGGLFSLLVMTFVYRLFYPFIGLVGTSLFGAYTHICTQVMVAYYVLIRHESVFLLLPIMFVISLVTGSINGLGACYLSKHIKKAFESYI